MAWYRAGTVSVTNGSATVTGAGTDFVSNASIGEAFLGPDSRSYEITQVVSATQIVLGMPYQGASAGGQGYSILPTQSFVRDLALAAAALLNSFSVVRDGVGQGLFPDGSFAAPGIRFANDQDTGIARTGPNVFALVAGGATRMQIQPDLVSVQDVLNIAGVGPSLQFSSNVAAWSISTPANTNALVFTERQFGSEKMRIDAGGNLNVGTATSSGWHRIVKPVGVGGPIITIEDGTRITLLVQGVSEQGWAFSNAALYIGKEKSNGRSLNLGGTLNASGADYAEYMLKAAGCGTIAKGDVCGVDRDGRLTKTWADAISFVIKSTDPSLVGGDTWDSEVGPKPDQPGDEPVAPVPPAPPAEDADDTTIAAWRDAMAAYPAQVAAYQAARAEWQKATDAYAKALPVWEAAHEKARACVDRIAFCGQVPANVDADFEVGDYIIAAASGAGIKAVAVKADDMTLPQYMRRIGKVWAVRDGRAWIDVQHG